MSLIQRLFSRRKFLAQSLLQYYRLYQCYGSAVFECTMFTNKASNLAYVLFLLFFDDNKIFVVCSGNVGNINLLKIVG